MIGNKELVIIIISILILLIPGFIIYIAKAIELKNSKQKPLCTSCWYCYDNHDSWSCNYPKGGFSDGYNLISLIPCQFFKTRDKPLNSSRLVTNNRQPPQTKRPPTLPGQRKGM